MHLWVSLLVLRIAIEAIAGEFCGNGSGVVGVREGHVNCRFESWALFPVGLYSVITCAIRRAIIRHPSRYQIRRTILETSRCQGSESDSPELT